MTAHSPIEFVFSILSADSELPAVFPHIQRGDPKAPAIILTSIGGEGLTGIGFTARRNIDSIRIEGRASSFMEAERILDRCINLLQRNRSRLVAVDGTLSDYDNANELYRAFATVDIRRA